jgi:hypothetical protein
VLSLYAVHSTVEAVPVMKSYKTLASKFQEKRWPGICGWEDNAK